MFPGQVLHPSVDVDLRERHRFQNQIHVRFAAVPDKHVVTGQVVGRVKNTAFRCRRDQRDATNLAVIIPVRHLVHPRVNVAALQGVAIDGEHGQLRALIEVGAHNRARR